MMQAPQFISRHPFAVQPERLPSGAMTESGRSYPSDDEQPKQNMLAISQRTSDLRSVSLPARKRSPDSPAAESNAMAATAAGSAPLPAVTPFLEDFNGVSHEASSTNYSPRTKTCLYKTEVCCSWKKAGKCRYGSKCQFAHGAEELRPVNRHPKYKTEVCRSYAQTGECRYGRRCRFLHPENDPLNTPHSTLSPNGSLTAPLPDAIPVSKVMQLPPHGFAHPPATDPPRNLSAYLSLVNPISPEQADLMPGRYVPPPPEDPTALLMNAVSQQQQHNAAMALLQNSHTPDSLGNVYASSYSATAPHSMHFQPPVAYSTGVNLPGPYGSAQPLSAYSGSLPSNVGVPDWNAQMPSLSQDVQMGQLAQLPQAPQYSPELLSLLAANQIPAVDHHAFNGLPNQVDLPSQMQSPLGHMDHMPADSQHMPRLSHNPCEDAYSHLASLGCGSSSVGNRQQVTDLNWSGIGYTPWVHANSY